MLKAWGASITAIGTRLFAVGAAATAAFFGAGKIFADTGSQLNDMATRTGITVEALSVLKYAAEQNSASVEDLDKGLGKMSRTIIDAARGPGPARDALERLNLTIQDLQGLSPDKQFELISD